MNFPSGKQIEPGDVIEIDGIYMGRVLASMDTSTYLPGEEGWSYLKVGIMVETSFAGLVHYTSDNSDYFVLIERPQA